MQNTKFIALDIGSGKLRLCAVEVNEGLINIRGNYEIDYDGVVDGQFLEDSTELQDSLRELFSDVDTEEYSKVYVNVPSDFCGLIKKTITKTFSTPIEFDNALRNEFLKGAQIDPSEIDGGIVLKKILGDFLPHSSTQIAGQHGQENLTADVDFIYASKAFIAKMDELLQICGLTDISYKCGIVEQAMQMTKSSFRDMGVVLIDTGYLLTSVVAVKGDKVESLYSFDLGGAHITTDLSEAFKISFKVAENLKQKVLLTVDPSEVDYYVVTDEKTQKEYELKASDVNQVVRARIEHIAKMVSKCVTEEQGIYQFLVTGGGLCEMKGALDILSSALGVVCKAEKLEMGVLEEYSESAIASLIKSAYMSEKIGYQNMPFYKKWWQKIKSVFKR